MPGVLPELYTLFNDLRREGLPVSTADQEVCCRTLLMVDWANEAEFYGAVFASLVKEPEHVRIFDEVFRRHFGALADQTGAGKAEKEIAGQGTLLLEIAMSASRSAGIQSPHGEAEFEWCEDNDRHRQGKKRERKNLLKMNFFEAAFNAPPEDLKRMEDLIPLMARRMAAKMVLKKNRDGKDRLDFRRTMRQSLNTGGVPLDLIGQKRRPEKPVIFALCDLSWSCLHYSRFSLSIVYALEKFFRQVRSFAFVDEAEEITDVVRRGTFAEVRKRVLGEMGVPAARGATDYGQTLTTFLERYGKYLNHKSYVLIFGDARTNWAPSRPDILQEIQKRVKRVYWFNPEPQAEWGAGDSSMLIYQKYCHRTFSCPNLEELARAICEIQ